MNSKIIFLVILILILFPTACNSTPPAEPTISPTRISETQTPSVELAATSTPTEQAFSAITTPVPVAQQPTLQPTPLPSLPELPDSVGSNICPNTQPSLLMPGRQGRVNNADPTPNRVRQEPNAQAVILGEIPAGAYFNVLEGPSCIDDGAWFKVRFDTLEGWMKEGSSTEYWVMPITSDAQTLDEQTVELAGLTINLPEELNVTAEVQSVPYRPAENRPPAHLTRLVGYPLEDPSPAIFIYPVEDFLYYRADLRPQLENIRRTINTLLRDPGAQVNLPEFRDAFLEEQSYMLQAGRFNGSFGWGIRGVTVTDDETHTPYYVFMGFSKDMASLVYVKLPIRLTFGQLSNTSYNNFTPSITQLDTLLGFLPLGELPNTTNPTAAGACPDAPPFTITMGDWARVSVDPPLSSRIRSAPGSGGTILGEAQAGENLLVIDGPQCANGYSWWKVRSLTGLEGWTAEGDASAYWLVEPISPWYQLPPPLPSGNLVTYNLREISISAPHALVSNLQGEYFPLATPMPTPASVNDPWPDDPRASIYTSAGHAAHSTYVLESNVIDYARISIFEIFDPRNRFYINNQSDRDCTGNLRDNLQNDPPEAAYVQWMCGIGGGIPTHFLVDVQKIEFTGGSGLRFLIASGNYLTVNELNYIFQGVSDDGRYYINVMVQNILHPYIVSPEVYWDHDFGPLLAWTVDTAAAEASYDTFNERIETLLQAHQVTTYPDLSLLDAMMASIVIK
jgi:hypothetical protein